MVAWQPAMGFSGGLSASVALDDLMLWLLSW